MTQITRLRVGLGRVFPGGRRLCPLLQAKSFITYPEICCFTLSRGMLLRFTHSQPNRVPAPAMGWLHEPFCRSNLAPMSHPSRCRLHRSRPAFIPLIIVPGVGHPMINPANGGLCTWPIHVVPWYALSPFSGRKTTHRAPSVRFVRPSRDIPTAGATTAKDFALWHTLP